MVWFDPHIAIALLIFVALSYGLVCALLYTIQEQLLFFPERDRPGTRYAFGAPFEEVCLPVDGATLHALWFRVPKPRGVVLYFHGNAGSLRSWGAEGAELAAWGYDVLMMDYRGYGQSSGRIDGEAQLHADAAAVYAWLRKHYAESEIVLYGRSIGSGLAVRLAAEQRPRLLILESPYDSLASIVRRRVPWLPPLLFKYPLHSARWIGQVRCPVVIIHGTDDTVVPFAHGEKLAAAVNAPLRFHAIAGGGHNDLAHFPAYATALREAVCKAF